MTVSAVAASRAETVLWEHAYLSCAVSVRGRAVGYFERDFAEGVARWRGLVGSGLPVLVDSGVGWTLDAALSAFAVAAGWPEWMRGAGVASRFLVLPEIPRIQRSPQQLRDDIARLAQSLAELARRAGIIPTLPGVQVDEPERQRWHSLASALCAAAGRVYQVRAVL